MYTPIPEDSKPPSEDSHNEQEDPRKKIRRLNKIFWHLRQEWYKYVIQWTVLTTGIIIAFSLEKWHLSNLEQEQFLDAYELIAQEIKLDTTDISKILYRFEKRKYFYESIINNSLTRAEYDSCYFCSRLVTSIYTISPTDKGFQHLAKLSDYRIGREDSLNQIIEEYYHAANIDVPRWQAFISDDIKENIKYWKDNMPWYHLRESHPEAMITYLFESPIYKNRVYVQRNLIYKNYVPLLKKLKKKGLKILKLIEAKTKLER